VSRNTVLEAFDVPRVNNVLTQHRPIADVTLAKYDLNTFIELYDKTITCFN